MKKEKAIYFAQNMPRLVARDRIFLNNPVVMQGLGLAPIVVAATTMKNAAILALAVIMMLTPVRVIAALICRFISSPRLRGAIYTLTSAAVFTGVYMLLVQLLGPAIQSVGLYLPLLIMEPIILKRYERTRPERASTALKKGVLTTLGFLLTMFLVAGARELLAYGTFCGVVVTAFKAWPMASLASGGFILVGVLAAFWRSMVMLFQQMVIAESSSES